MTFYNAEFVYRNVSTGAQETYIMRNLSGKRLMEVRRAAFADGLFIGSETGNKKAEDKIFPFHVGTIIPPTKIEAILLTVIAIKEDDKEKSGK